MGTASGMVTCKRDKKKGLVQLVPAAELPGERQGERPGEGERAPVLLPPLPAALAAAPGRRGELACEDEEDEGAVEAVGVAAWCEQRGESVMLMGAAAVVRGLMQGEDEAAGGKQAGAGVAAAAAEADVGETAPAIKGGKAKAVTAGLEMTFAKEGDEDAA
jgi:hypothetical protein